MVNKLVRGNSGAPRRRQQRISTFFEMSHVIFNLQNDYVICGIIHSFNYLTVINESRKRISFPCYILKCLLICKYY